MIRDDVSLVIPAKNEAASLQRLLPKLLESVRAEQIYLVDDGSTDETAQIADDYGVHRISHPYSMGNGAAIKSGARQATGELLLFMDADGQHDPADIPRLLEKLDQGYDMVVGARDVHSQASWGRGMANRLYNQIASYMTGQRIDDLTSGFRLVRAHRFREFLHLLPNGFSYPTTSTMAFFRAGYPVGYLPIHAASRVGKSHIQPIHDGLRFLLIIFKVGTLYSPLKLFAPLAAIHFVLGFGYYLFTFWTQHRLSNMSVFMFSAAVTTFLIGLVSEQITQLLYQPRDRDG